MWGSDGYEIVHAGTMAVDKTNGVLLVGSPGSGKGTLILARATSCRRKELVIILMEQPTCTCVFCGG